MSSPSSGIQKNGAHLTPEQMQSYRSRTLGVEELVLASRHLEGCAACRRALRSVMGAVALPEEVRMIPEPLHLSYEQITAYLDGTSPDVERTEAHLFLCASCSRELEDLRTFDSQLAVPAEEKAEIQAERVPLRERLGRLFAVPGLAGRLGFSCAAMIAGFVLLYRADLSTEFQAGSGGAAHVMRIGAEMHPGLSVGGILLVGLGAASLLYFLLRRR